MRSLMSAINPRQWFLANAARSPGTLSDDGVKRASLMLAAVTLLLGGVLPETNAGYITQNGSTSVFMDIYTTGPGGDRFNGGTDGTSLTKTVTDSLGDTVTGTASASVAAPWSLVTNSNVKMDFPGLISGVVPGSAGARAEWQDIMFLSISDPRVVGNTLRLNFQATGSFSVPLNDASLSAQKDVFANTGFISVGKSAGVFPGGGTTGYWDTLQTSGNSYTGVLHLDVPIQYAGYIPGIPGSIYFRMDATVQTNAHVCGNPFSQSTEASASDPLQFVSITLPDVGDVTPESLGVSVTFDSGLMSPNIAVPEPATITLLGIGIAGMAGYGWRRRKVPAAS